MTKREIRKEAFTRIIKKNHPHQHAYDKMVAVNPESSDDIAEELSKFPDKKRQHSKKNLVMAYVVVLALIVILRIVSVIVTPEIMHLPAPLLLVMVALTMVVPIVGIVMALKHKVDAYRSIGLLFIVSIARSLKYLTGDPIEFVAFIPIVIAIILAFVIPGQLKVPYKKELVTTGSGEEEKKVMRAVFEETETVSNSEELLDSKI